MKMVEPNYRIYRIDGPVTEDTIITLGDKAFRESIMLLKGRYVTVIVLADNETLVGQMESDYGNG